MTTPFDIAADPEGNPQPAPAEQPEVVVEQAPPPPKRRGRKPRRTVAAPPPDAPPVMQSREIRMAAPPDGLPRSPPSPPDAFEENPNEIVREPGAMWTILCRQWTDSGRNIDELQAIIMRTKVDGRIVPPVQVQPILTGGQVSGDERMSPGEQLMEHLELVAHRDMGPASYKVNVRNKHTGKTVRVSEEIALESYAKIVQRRMQIEDAQRRRMYGEPSYARPVMQATATPGGIPAPPGMDPLTKHLLDTVLGQLNDTRAELAALRGQPAPQPVTLPQVPTGSPVDPQEQFLRQLETQRRIAALLHPPQPTQNLEQTVTQIIVRLQEAGVIPKNTPVTTQTNGPAPGSFEAWIEARKKDQEYERVFRARFPEYIHKDEVAARGNVQDPNDGPAPSKEFPLSTYMGEALRWVPWPGSENAPEGWGEWLGRMASENPRRATDLFGGILKAAASVLPMDKLSGLMEAMTKRGGQAATAVAEHTAANGGPAATGWSPGT